MPQPHTLPVPLAGCLPKAARLSENLIGFRPPAIGSRANSGASGDDARPTRSAAMPRLSSAPQQQQSRPASAHQQQQRAESMQLPSLHQPSRPAAAQVQPAAANVMAMLGWRRYTGIRKVMQEQAAEFSRQLTELHR